MAIITKPTISKGQANEFDLSKSELAAVSKVVNDSYFSDQTNWYKVIIEYKSTEGNQHEMMIFDASEASPKGNFEVSEKARDDWEVQSVKIMDFDGGYLKLERGDLTVADFDILLSAIVGSVLQENSSYWSAGNWQAYSQWVGMSSGDNKGQTYQHSADHTLTSIIIGLQPVGAPNVNVVVKVYDDAAKTTLLGTSDLVAASSLSGQNEVEFNFSTNVTGLLASTTYYFELSFQDVVAMDGSNYLAAATDAGVNSYANGQYYSNGSPSASSDLYFKVKGA